jgi:geranylgeranyl pyrophosphate synthase
VNDIRNAALPYMVLPEMRQYWIEATARPRPDWELPALVASALDPDFRPSAIANTVMAAIGCCQIAIILVDDLLDDDPKGAYQTLGAGKAANLALAFQSLGVQLIGKLDLPSDQIRLLGDALNTLCLQTAVGQHRDVSQTTWSEELYWQVVSDKSAPFYAGVMSLGALMHGRLEAAPTFHAIGRLVGEMVQIRDDLVDIMAEPAAPDWAHGGNLLLIYARNREEPEEVAEFEALVADVLAGQEGALERAQQFLIDDAAVDYCALLLRNKADDALACLRSSGTKNHQPVQDLLDKLVTQVTDMCEVRD